MGLPIGTLVKVGHGHARRMPTGQAGKATGLSAASPPIRKPITLQAFRCHPEDTTL
jgi:hypothetical protein